MRLLPLLLALTSPLFASSPAVWEMSSFSDFIKGKFDGISLGRDGRMSLAPKLDTFFSSEQPVIWSVAVGPDGSLYAATGHRGRVFRIDASGKSQLVWTADRPEVFAIAVDKAGVVYAGSSPDGKIYRIENGKASEYFDPKSKYIWTLALAPDGALYAGTADGKVFRITGAGKGEEYYSTGQGNVTGLIVDSKGALLAGTEPNGILYRITAKDKAFALYDSSLPEIRALALNADGSIYAVGLGGALAKKVQAAQQTQTQQTDTSGGTTTTITVTADAGGDLKPTPPEPAKPQQAAPASVTPTVTATAVDLSSVEKSAIYRINTDNTVDTLWSSKEENVYDILPSPDGQIYFCTDQNGRVYRLGAADRKLTLIAQTNESEAVRLLRWNGALLAATANMGKIYRLGAASAKGSYESPVFDAGGIARWGKLRWQGDKAAGGVALRTRSGNSLRPDNTWSDWSEPLRDGAGVQIASPNARYLQFTADLSGAGPVLDSVSAAYLPQNNPPVVRSITVLTQAVAAQTKAAAPQSTNTSSAATVPYSITVTDSGDPAPVASTGTPTQTLSRAASQQLTISWQADDPDTDRLVYDVEFRGDGDGEREWKSLKKNLHDNSVSIDGDALADGRYLFRVTASDREANASGSARDADLVSSPVLIDNTPPAIRVRAATRASIEFEAQDAVSALKRAEWSVDAGPWTPLAPVDGILDSPTEQFRFTPVAPAGEHVVVIRVVDSGNNTALARVILH
jgi:hypothetical protein